MADIAFLELCASHISLWWRCANAILGGTPVAIATAGTIIQQLALVYSQQCMASERNVDHAAQLVYLLAWLLKLPGQQHLIKHEVSLHWQTSTVNIS